MIERVLRITPGGRAMAQRDTRVGGGAVAGGPPGLPVLVRPDWRVAALGGAVFALLMALSPFYGFHRDELYFLDCARHLQGSYVDQPVLTPLQRRNAVIFTTNYGEAGAINELGRGMGLPVAVSGHNSEWWWGPGDPRATTVEIVAGDSSNATAYQGYLQTLFRRVRATATLSNPAGIHNQEWGGHVYVCTGPLVPWGELWPELRHYD